MNRALESILLSVLSALEAEMVFIRNLVGGLLAELEDDIDHDRFKRLLHYSRRLASFQNRAKLVSRFSPSICSWRRVVLSYLITELRDTGGYGLGQVMNKSPRSPVARTPVPDPYVCTLAHPGQSAGSLRHASSVP